MITLLATARHGVAFVKLYLKRSLPLSHLLRNLGRYMRVFRAHGMEVHEFFQLGLWYPMMRTEGYTRFIGWRKHIRALIHLNPVEYRCMTENKLAFFTYCRAQNIPTPHVYALFHPHMIDTGGIAVVSTVEGLKHFLQTGNITSVVIKPVDGTKGQSVFVVEYAGGTFETPTGAIVTDDELGEALQGYAYRGSRQRGFLIQRRVRPHAATRALSENVPFSYRVLTIRKTGEAPEVVDVYAKASRNDRTDNFHAGGFILSVDREGVCRGARLLEGGGKLLERHCDTGFVFSGWRVPFYGEACALALRAAEAFYFVKCVAWDIAVGGEGLSIIEGNNPWNYDIQMANERGLWQGAFEQEASRLFREGVPRSPWW
jgi:hypothetical protein